MSQKIGVEIIFKIENISPALTVALDREIEQELRQFLAKDIAIYEFVVNHGIFNKALHSDNLRYTPRLPVMRVGMRVHGAN